MTQPIRRRDFLAQASVLLAFTWLGVPGTHRGSRHGPHPEPRPGIDASRVLTGEQLADYPGVISAFDQVREIPQIVDGIRCSCGCASREGFYSLLSCYEGEGMARHCEVCQGTGRMAYRLHKQGKTLNEIREALDLRYR
jgi:hypothetical protein